MERVSPGLGHLFMSNFLHHFAKFMVIPAITDVTMSALCPGRDECSLAIYLSGFQQATSPCLLFALEEMNAHWLSTFQVSNRLFEGDMEHLSTLRHLFLTFFLYNFSTHMVIPAMTDVTLSALCPGQAKCSLAIYLTGFRHAIMGLGSLIMMPLVGNLSDKHGRKALLSVPMTLTIIPLAILAYSRTKNFYYAYFVFHTLTSMLSEGSVHCLSLAYVADHVDETRRASVFGILSGISSASFVFGNLSTRFLSTASTFQVSTTMAILALVYMRIFLRDPIVADELTEPIVAKGERKLSSVDCSDQNSKRNVQIFKTLPSLEDTLFLLKSSKSLSQAAVVAFFGNLAEVGLHASLLYYLKARFHFNKDQFADLMVISGIAGTISQLLVMPLLVPVIGEGRLLSIGILFSCAHMFLYGIAWSFWVPYVAAMFSVLFVFSQPCIRSIVSKQVGPYEQGKAQGCISGICSFANVVSPLAFSPLTALFLSDAAPFHFPGFSIMCAGMISMMAFVQSIMISLDPPIPDQRVSNCDCVDA